MTGIRWMRAAALRFFAVFTRASHDREYRREIEGHLQLHIDDNLRAGKTPDDARRRAIAKFGGLEAAREAYGDRRGVPVLEQFGQDFRYGMRLLGKHRAFSAVAISTLARFQRSTSRRSPAVISRRWEFRSWRDGTSPRPIGQAVQR
jgi:hypothetical protein